MDQNPRQSKNRVGEPGGRFKPLTLLIVSIFLLVLAIDFSAFSFTTQ